MKSFTYSGVWWLPSQEEHKVAGEATFSGDDETKLVLHGAFAHDFKSARIELSWYPIILGITAAGQPITLLHCQETSFGSYSGEEGEGQEQECSAEIAYVGSHFTDPQQILFNKVDVHYSYLPQWTGLFPYYRHQKPFDGVSAATTKGTITVQPIQNVWHELTKKTNLLNQADLPEIVLIRFEAQEALPLDEWMTQFIAPLQHLISLATQRPNALVNIVGYIKQNGTDGSKNEISELPVQITFIPAITPIMASRGTVPETILFSLQEIMPNFSRVIETWLHMADELENTFRFFLECNTPISRLISDFSSPHRQ